MERENKDKKGFLKKLDRYLLTYMPVTWSSRIHISFFYGMLFLLFLLGISFIVPDDPRNNAEVYTWVIALSIISVLAFIFWMIFLLRFNVFKRYGKWGELDSLKSFIFYFLIVLLFVSWPYVPPGVQSVRANMAYSTQELIGDINDMNTMICRLERDSIDLKFKADTLQLKQDVEGTMQRLEKDEEGGYTTYSDNYIYADSVSMENRLLSADSSIRLNDSMYIIYECPDYKFVEVYRMPSWVSEKIFGSIDLYHTALEYKTEINKPETLRKLNELVAKYREGRYYPSYYSMPYYDYNYLPQGYFNMIRSKYKLGEVNDSFNNIADRKYRWDDRYIGVSLRAAYYITLIFSLLVFIYRHSSRKTFFLSLLAGVLLLIFTMLFVVATTHEGNMSGWYIFYFVIFSLISSIIFFKKTRGVFSGIALNLALFMVPLVPFTIVNLYYFYLHERYDSPPYDTITSLYVFRNEELHYFLAEIGGFVLLLALVATVIQKAYRRWYALPEQ